MISCQQTPICNSGEPTPIFAISSPIIKQHYFKLDSSELKNELVGLKSIEKVILQDSQYYKNPIYLEIYQHGCQDIYQQYNFSYNYTIPGIKEVDTKLWFKRATSELRKFAYIDEQYKSIWQWANSIDDYVKNNPVSLGEPFELNPSVFVAVDRIISDDSFILVVSLEQQGNN